MARNAVKEIIKNAPNRRNFVRNLGFASAAVGVSAVVDPAKAEAQSVSDIDVLNFALNIEYLEAEFYTVVTTGKTIDQFGVAISGGIGTTGVTTGGGMVPFSNSDITVQRIAQELAADERTHVSLLQNAITALGGAYVNKPAINLSALEFGYESQSEFLQLARIIEEIGMSAYGGMAGLMADKAALGFATRILSAESEHVGNLRTLLSIYGVSSGPVLDLVDVPTPSSSGTTGVRYFSTDANALTSPRTPGQALLLLFGGASRASGGFFPLGLSGNSVFAESANTPAANTTAVFTATPNPIPLNAGSAYGQANITWNVPPPVQYIQIRVGSPTGPIFTTNFPSGSLMTKVWATEGMVLYLQDISNGKPLTAQNTLATLIFRTYLPS